MITAITIVAASSSAAKAEDELYYGRQAQPQPQASAPQGADQQYSLPQKYNDKYYPDDETAIGYHGTARTSDNSNYGQNPVTTQQPAPYYYYYY